ncbi:trihelix transcription factor GTL1-like [Megalops cyprinoides]|uniref:trihelix transcription factor GTL1-like n=1 Tax=Megalops cyprinoides TaxID=118141 RepID=UPI0018641F22|nr:trihelix transcription factor GTL1-like [Megalops cyprinoides]
MEVKSKQQWSLDETNCLLALWSSTEVQIKLGASRTKPVFEELQRELAAAGYDRSVEQINNKLKKLRKEYRDQKKNPGQSGSGRTRINPHFDLLDSVLGDGPACQQPGAFSSVTAKLEAMVDGTPQSSAHPELSAIDDVSADAEPPPPLACSSPTPSCSSGALSSASSSQQAGRGKRKRDDDVELLQHVLQYLERANERFLQHSKDTNAALLQKMEADTSALLGLMGRMVGGGDH